MPKFLDAPSWYNIDGLETKANGVTFVNVANLDETTHNLYAKPDGTYVYECTSGTGLSLKIYVTSSVYLSFSCKAGMQPIVVQKIQCIGTHVWEYYIDGYGYALPQTNSPYSTSSGAITLMSSIGSGLNGSIVRVSSNGTVTIYNQLFYGLNNQYGLQTTKFYAPISSGNMDGQTLVSRSGSAPVWETRGIFGLRVYTSGEVPGVIIWFPFDPNISSGSSFVSLMKSMGCTSMLNFYPAIGRAYEPGQNPAGGDVYGVYVSGSTVNFVGVKGDLSETKKSLQSVWGGNAEMLSYTSIGSAIS